MKKWIVLAVFVFALYSLRVPSAPESVVHSPVLVDFGAVWDLANATRSWIQVNTTRPVEVTFELFRHPVGASVFFLNFSDSPFLSNLSATLRSRLVAYGFSVDRFSSDRVFPPGTLVVLEPIPGNFLPRFSELVEQGWVVFYAGPPVKSEGSGITFKVKDALKNEVRLEAANASVMDKAGWQILQKGRGYFVYRPKSLELSGKNPVLAAEELAAFIDDVGWSFPIAKIHKVVNSSGTVVSPAFFSPEAFGIVTMLSESGTFRRSFSVNRPNFRVFVSSPVFWPDPGEFSFIDANGPMLVRVEGPRKLLLGRFSPKEKKVFAALPTENLSEGEYRVVFDDQSGSFVSAAYLRVENMSAKPVFIDGTSRTFFVRFGSGPNPATYRKVRWKNQTARTDESGVAKFKDAVSGRTTFYLDDKPISVDLVFDDPIFSPGALSILAAVPILVFAWWAAKKWGRTFVTFHPPIRRPRRNILLTSGFLRQLFGKEKLSVSELVGRLSFHDPHQHVDEDSLKSALEKLVSRGWLKRKGDCYCVLQLP